MLWLHISDAAIGAWIVYAMKLIPSIHGAFCFNLNTHTSLSYGAMPLRSNWRELGPLMAISGC